MSAARLRVRPAEERDLYSLWLWANDPETRRASFGRETIPWIEHVAWFERQRSDEAPIFIVPALGGGFSRSMVRICTGLVCVRSTGRSPSGPAGR